MLERIEAWGWSWEFCDEGRGFMGEETVRGFGSKVSLFFEG